jgi:ATP-dependent DNA ligase
LNSSTVILVNRSGSRISRCASSITFSATRLRDRHAGIVFNAHYVVDGGIVFKNACALGCEGIVSKRLGSTYRSGRSASWVKVKNPKAPAVKREAEKDWGRH